MLPNAVMYVTSAGSGPSAGSHLLMAYLPASVSPVGTKLLVEYLGEQYPVTVASHGAGCVTARRFPLTDIRRIV